MKKVQTINKLKGFFGLFAAFAMAIGVGVSLAPKGVIKTEAASPYTYTFTAQVYDAYDQTKTLGDYDWHVTRTAATASDYLGNDATKGQQFGSKNHYVTKLNLTTSGISGTITEVEISTSGASSVTANVGIKVGASSFLSGGSTTKAITATNTAYSFVGSASGSIDIEWNNTSKKAIYVKTIKVTYTEGGGEPDPATSVVVSAAGEATSLLIGGTLQLSAEVLPKPGASQVVTWSSSNTSVATVNSSTGLVTGVGSGDVTITATSSTAGIYGVIELNVTEPIVYDGYETFEKSTLTGSSYVNGSFAGDEVTIAYAAARPEDAYGITNKGIMFGTTAGYIEFTLTNGIAAIKFDWKKAFTGAGSRQLGVYINGTQVASTPALDVSDTQSFEHLFATPYSGNTTVKIANLQGKQVTLDNIAWLDGPEVTFGTLDHIVVNSDSVKKSYYESETLSLSGLVVMAYDTVGKDKNVTSDITSSPAQGYTFTAADGVAGTKLITISYNEGTTKSDSFSVTVLPIIQPEHIVSNVGSVFTESGDGGTPIALESDVKNVFTGEKIGLLESAIVQADGEDTQSRMYYAGTANIKAGVQPLKFGSSSGKGNVKFTFTDEIRITKVTLFVARFSTSGTNVTMQVVGATAQNIGVASTIDAMFAPYEFVGSFGNEVVIRNNTNLAAYLYGVDIEYKTYEEDALSFANEVMTGSGNLANGSCETVLEDLEEMYDGLTEMAQLEFETSDDTIFVQARARMDYLKAWVAAQSDGGSGKVNTPVNDNNSFAATIIIGVIGLTTLAGYYFLQKKKEA